MTGAGKGNVRVKQQAKRGTHRSVWPHDTGNSDRHRPHAAQIVPWKVHVEENLRDYKPGDALLAHAEQLERVDRRMEILLTTSNP